MSAVLIPKLSETRPPILPPTRTTFDGTPPEDGDPLYRRLAESVNRLVRTVDHTPADRLELLLRLLEQRKGWIETELMMERLFENETLPPVRFFNLDYVFETRSTEEAAYIRLLSVLDDAIGRVRMKMPAQNTPPEASQP